LNAYTFVLPKTDGRWFQDSKINEGMRVIREIGNFSLMLALNLGGFSGIWERSKMIVV
jgi:hypothetical protein